MYMVFDTKRCRQAGGCGMEACVRIVIWSSRVQYYIESLGKSLVERLTIPYILNVILVAAISLPYVGIITEHNECKIIWSSLPGC